jgi:DNA-3-methyladenine glycosylase I
MVPTGRARLSNADQPGSADSDDRGEKVGRGGERVPPHRKVPLTKTPKADVVRCRWATNALSILYHDREWGVPQHDDRVLFEFLILEGAQAGLSWDTILEKRENDRAAFDGFNPAKVARYDRRREQALLRNPGIVRNRLKIASAIANARAFLAVQKEFGSFDRYLEIRWRQAARECPSARAQDSGAHSRV